MNHLIISFLFLFTALLHEYHVGFYTIVVKENTCQITMKLFSDDFEKALHKQGNEVKIGDDLLEKELSLLLRSYISSHFKLSMSGNEKKLNFVGAEWDDDYHAMYFYWECELNESDKKEINIENSIFLEISKEQQNMHHIKFDDKEYTLLLDYNKRTSTVSLN